MSLTKSQMVDWIADKTGQNEPDERAACANFLQARLRMCWQKAQWLDSQMEFQLALDPVNDELHKVGLVKLPPVFRRLLATRTTNHSVLGQKISQRYRVDLDSFNEVGTACVSSELGRAVWVYNSPVQLTLTGNNTGEDAGKSVFIRYVDVDGARREETWNIVTDTEYTLAAEAVQVEVILKQETAVAVLLNAYYDASTPTIVSQLFAGDLEAKKPLWLRLAEVPKEAETLYTLGRVEVPEWHDDEEAPLRDSADMLLAYALGDMEQRHRQFAKADKYFAEGGALLADLKEIEADQTADVARLIPEADHYNSDYGFSEDNFLSKF